MLPVGCYDAENHTVHIALYFISASPQKKTFLNFLCIVYLVKWPMQIVGKKYYAW